MSKREGKQRIRKVKKSWDEREDEHQNTKGTFEATFIPNLQSTIYYSSLFLFTHLNSPLLLPIIITFLNSSCFNLSSFSFPFPLFCFPFHSAIPSSFLRVFPHRGRDGRREETNGRYPVRTGWWASWGRGRWRTRG